MTKPISALVLIGCLVWPGLVLAQTQAQLDNAVRFGALATVGPLCGLRDERWAADLRRAELQAMGADAASPAPDPGRQRRHDTAGAALSYAEDEALENFAAAAPAATCAPLAQNPDLTAADKMVAAYRVGSGVPLW